MGLSIPCKKCDGSGDMGLFVTSLCNVCKGTGKIEIEGGDAELLYEFFEGLVDEDTDEEWLENQLRRLLESRKKKKA